MQIPTDSFPIPDNLFTVGMEVSFFKSDLIDTSSCYRSAREQIRKIRERSKCEVSIELKRFGRFVFCPSREGSAWGMAPLGGAPLGGGSACGQVGGSAWGARSLFTFPVFVCLSPCFFGGHFFDGLFFSWFANTGAIFPSTCPTQLSFSGSPDYQSAFRPWWQMQPVRFKKREFLRTFLRRVPNVAHRRGYKKRLQS